MFQEVRSVSFYWIFCFETKLMRNAVFKNWIVRDILWFHTFDESAFPHDSQTNIFFYFINISFSYSSTWPTILNLLLNAQNSIFFSFSSSRIWNYFIGICELDLLWYVKYATAIIVKLSQCSYKIESYQFPSFRYSRLFLQTFTLNRCMFCRIINSRRFRK